MNADSNDSSQQSPRTKPTLEHYELISGQNTK